MKYVRRSDLIAGGTYKVSGDLGNGIKCLNRYNHIKICHIDAWDSGEVIVSTKDVTFNGREYSQGCDGWTLGEETNFERVATEDISDDWGFEYDEAHPLNDIVESIMRGSYG